MLVKFPVLFAQPDDPATGGWEVWAIVGAALLVLFIVAVLVFVFAYGKLWLQAYMSSARIHPFSLVGMGLRQVNPNVIVTAKVMAVQAGLDILSSDVGISTRRLEAHYLAGGNVLGVVNAVIAAHRAGIDLDFDRAAAIDLAGRDVVDAVRTSVLPKVIDCPDPQRGKAYLSAIAMDGIELRVRARVTVRTNLEQLIGGATEDTVIARVGESIISAIGSAASHNRVLENPDMITRKVLERGLDAHTAFEIVSIDIADIDVGENVGARLQVDQAEADTRMRRAEAEQRRAEAVAFEQEMKAKVADNRSRLILAEAEVPRAMADAFRQGNIYAQNGPA